MRTTRDVQHSTPSYNVFFFYFLFLFLLITQNFRVLPFAAGILFTFSKRLLFDFRHNNIITLQTPKVHVLNHFLVFYSTPVYGELRLFITPRSVRNKSYYYKLRCVLFSAFLLRLSHFLQNKPTYKLYTFLQLWEMKWNWVLTEEIVISFMSTYYILTTAVVQVNELFRQCSRTRAQVGIKIITAFINEPVLLRYYFLQLLINFTGNRTC